MIQLTWDWSIFWAITVVGFASGYAIGTAPWPVSTLLKMRPPVTSALIYSILGWLVFFGTLATFRYLSGSIVELQATVLNLVFILTSYGGLWLRSRR